MPPLARERNLANFLADPYPQNNFQCEGRVKCVLVGDGAIGKTSLVVSYTTNGYPTEYVPTAFDNYNVVVTVDNHPVRLQLCDTAGQDDFDTLRPLCYPTTDVFLLCFSVVSPTSFYNVADKWIPELRHHCPSTPIILVGTQCDLRSDVKVLIELANYREQPVNENDARRLARKVGAATYIECSALTQKNLKEVFDTAIMVVLQRNEALRKVTCGKAKGKKVGKGLQPTERPPLSPLQEKYFEQSYTDIHSRASNKKKKKKKGWKKYCCFS